METLRYYLVALAEGHIWIRWTTAAAIVAVGTLMLVALRSVMHRRLSRLAPQTDNRVDDVLADLVNRTSLSFLVALPTLLALSLVDLPARVERIGRGLALLICLLQAGLWGSRGLRELVERRFGGASEDAARRTVALMISLIGRVILWTVLVLVALDNMGVDITALVAGLGVGGVAVALATQNILGDLFASVSILLDKPFVPGDFIIVGEFMGTVEQVGIKTTRVRSLSGEQIVFSNADLLQSRLRNYKRMYERRVVWQLKVLYQTPTDKLEQIPRLLREIVEAHQPKTRFDRAHFSAFDDWALTFEVVYFVLDPDYNLHMNMQQDMFLTIHRRFAELGIGFAYPTQTLDLPESTRALLGNGAGNGHGFGAARSAGARDRTSANPPRPG